MIYKNINAYGSDNITLLEFGYADISIATGIIETGTPDKRKKSFVVYKNTNKEEDLIGKNLDEHKFDVLMVFDNEKSIDVVIESLTKAKERLSHD